MVYKVQRAGPNIVDLIKDGKIRIVFNTPLGRESFYDDGAIRKSATLHNVLVRHHAHRHRRHGAGDPRAARERDRRAVAAGDPRAGARRIGRPGGTRVAPLLVKPLYLALSGGGAHAAAHAGVLRALEREGAAGRRASPGVSGGALVAAAWAGGADLDQLVEQASRLHPWMWVRGWGGGLLSGSRLGRADRRVPARADASRACACPWWCWRPTSTPARPSSSARAACATRCGPRAASPASSRRSCGTAGGSYDGGVTEVVPVRLAREMAGDDGVVVAIDCNAGGRWPAADSFIAIALRAGLTLVRGRTRVGAGRRRPRDLARDRRVRLDAADARSRPSPTAGEEALVAGLPELRRLLGE